MEYTKGKWEIKTPNNSCQTIESEYGNICTISQPFGIEEAEANAKLISAAPDLLQALQESVAELQFSLHNQAAALGMDPSVANATISENRILKQAKAAIQKATE